MKDTFGGNNGYKKRTGPVIDTFGGAGNNGYKVRALGFSHALI